MPIYEYRCNDCDQVFEEWLKTFDETEQRTCPVCGGHAERIMSNTTFVLKGGGWYVTEYGNQKASAPAPASTSDATPANTAKNVAAPASAPSTASASSTTAAAGATS